VMIFYSLLVGGIVLGLPMAIGAYFLSMAILRRNDRTIQLQFTDPPDPTVIIPADPGIHDEPGILDQTIEAKHPITPLYTLITGASSGLGREMAIECAERGMNLILVALPGRNLDILCDVLEEEYGIIARYYERDLTGRDAIVKLVKDILPHYRINFLINNAGTGGTIPFEESSVEYLERIIQLNITAVSLLTRLLLPEIQKHPEALILNVSSMAAFSPFPYKTIYQASKAFVSNFSKSLAQELKETHVKVSVLHPGPIMTNHDASVRIINLGANGRRGLILARELARIGIDGVQRGKRTMIPGMGNLVNWLMMTKLPQWIVMRVLTRVMAKEVKKKKQLAA
ncbi:MAG: SDR family NAD(P)-dependent oxidoreductase, partial [Bacteroidetes bacterium]|nr:SDR family NAD(P)-dependent oxidoreductase [Bacteroidota bacterium]